MKIYLSARLSAWVQRMAIKHVLMVIILGVSGFSLSIGFAVVIAWESRSARLDLVNQSLLFARVVGDYSISALAFDDKRAGTDSLAKLEAVPEISSAYLYDSQGVLLASYEPNSCGQDLRDPDPIPSGFRDGHLVVEQPIELGGEVYGSVRLCVATESLERTTRLYSMLMVSVLALLLALSAMAALALQGLISDPILKLATTAQRITRAGDYSIRAPRPAGSTEIVALYDAWNAMLDQIESRRRRNEEYRAVLQNTNLKLERNARALVSSNQQLEQFAYVASHDLQEPLRTVSSYVQLLARRYAGQLDSDADDFIGFAVDGAKRMQALIEDLLTFSRITAERPLEATDCEDILNKVRSNLRATIEENAATLSFDSLPVIEVDATQLLQLFQNLVINAIKFRREDPPRVHVSARHSEGEWIFGVQDNGLGIETEYQERIFTIFQRLHERECYPGTGIGLALCKKIVERHHGRIWVESEYGSGSTFYFTIPDDSMVHSSHSSN